MADTDNNNCPSCVAKPSSVYGPLPNNPNVVVQPYSPSTSEDMESSRQFYAMREARKGSLASTGIPEQAQSTQHVLSLTAAMLQRQNASEAESIPASGGLMLDPDGPGAVSRYRAPLEGAPWRERAMPVRQRTPEAFHAQVATMSQRATRAMSDEDALMPSQLTAPWIELQVRHIVEGGCAAVEQNNPFPPPDSRTLSELLDVQGRRPPNRVGDPQPLVGRTSKDTAGSPDSDTIHPPVAGEAGEKSCTWSKSYLGMAALTKAFFFDFSYKYAWYLDLRDALEPNKVADSDLTQETVVGERIANAIDRAKNALEDIVAGGYLPPASQYGDLVSMLEGHVNADPARPNPCSHDCPKRRIDLNSWKYSHKTWAHPQIFNILGNWTWEWVWLPRAGWWLFRTIRKRVALTYTLHFQVEYTISCIP